MDDLWPHNKICMILHLFIWPIQSQLFPILFFLCNIIKFLCRGFMYYRRDWCWQRTNFAGLIDMEEVRCKCFVELLAPINWMSKIFLDNNGDSLVSWHTSESNVMKLTSKSFNHSRKNRTYIYLCARHHKQFVENYW